MTLCALASLLVGCNPQREFITFGDAGTFQPGPRQSSGEFSGPQGEYDSYELIDHGGAPNHGVQPMYSGQQGGFRGHQQPPHGGGYPKAVETYDRYGNPQTIIIPNPW